MTKTVNLREQVWDRRVLGRLCRKIARLDYLFRDDTYHESRAFFRAQLSHQRNCPGTSLLFHPRRLLKAMEVRASK